MAGMAETHRLTLHVFQYLAIDPKGRAIMVSAVEKQKLVYIMNCDSASRLTISSPLEVLQPSPSLAKRSPSLPCRHTRATPWCSGHVESMWHSKTPSSPASSLITQKLTWCVRKKHFSLL